MRVGTHISAYTSKPAFALHRFAQAPNKQRIWAIYYLLHFYLPHQTAATNNQTPNECSLWPRKQGRGIKVGFIWGGALIACALMVREDGGSWTASGYAERPAHHVTFQITFGSESENERIVFVLTKLGEKTSRHINVFVWWGQLLCHWRENHINVEFNKANKCGGPENIVMVISYELCSGVGTLWSLADLFM